MKSMFEMSMMRELNYFLGLQVKQCKEGIFINQTKYTRHLIKKFRANGIFYKDPNEHVFVDGDRQ